MPAFDSSLIGATRLLVICRYEEWAQRPLPYWTAPVPFGNFPDLDSGAWSPQRTRLSPSQVGFL